MTGPDLYERVARGHEAERARETIEPTLREREERVIREALTELRGGTLTPDQALLAWCRLATQRELRADLIRQERVGQSASRKIRDQLEDPSKSAPRHSFPNT